MSATAPEYPQFDRKTHAEFFRRNGYVVLEDCLPLDFIARLNKAFMELMEDKIRKFGLAPIRETDKRKLENNSVHRDFRPEGGNHDFNRWNMHLPTTPLFLSEELVAHPHVTAVLDEVFGGDYIAFLVASDTPYPGAGFQNIHQDFSRFGVTVNIPLVDFTERNAPLEIWPGSHLKQKGDVQPEFHKEAVSLSKDELNRVNQAIQSQRMMLKAGSILIRDHRLVHRGTANSGQSPRPCLSIWYKKVDGFSLTGLSIPTPHRGLCDRVARYALDIRREGKGSGSSIKNKSLLNLGNYLGRFVEEFAGSDRDYRRVIPESLWRSFSPKMRHLLRYASVENPEKNGVAKRSLLGSGILVSVTALFFIASLYSKLRFHPRF